MESLEKYYTIQEVADADAVSRWTIQREIEDGRLVAERRRDGWRIPASAVAAYRSARRAEAEEEAAARRAAKSATAVSRRPVGRPRKLAVGTASQAGGRGDE